MGCRIVTRSLQIKRETKGAFFLLHQHRTLTEWAGVWNTLTRSANTQCWRWNDLVKGSAAVPATADSRDQALDSKINDTCSTNTEWKVIFIHTKKQVLVLDVSFFCLLFFASDFCQTYGAFLILCQSIFSLLIVYFSEICIPISCIFFSFQV